MKRNLLVVAVAAMTLVSIGCAITDYSGIGDHNSGAEAKLWGKDIGWITGDDNEGTYVFTVKYDNRGGQGTVTINSYKNDVVGSFTRDGTVDQDGDYIQGSAGTLGGKFLPWFKAVDPTGGSTCEFFDNITFDKSAGGPGVALCIFGFVEEVDRDDLGASWGSIDDLLQSIWNGAVGAGFTAEVNGITLNGVSVPVENFSVLMSHNGQRPATFTFDMTQPAAAGLIQGILDNTDHLAPVSIGLSFDGGMQVSHPAFRAAFNHDALWAML